MRVESVVKTAPWKSESSQRNCGTGYDCEWKTQKQSGEIQFVRNFVRSDIQKNPSVNGWRPPSAYIAELNESSVMQGSAEWTGLFGYGSNAAGGQRVKRDGAFYQIAVASGYTAPSARDSARLKGKALSKLKNQQLDLSMALATRRQTMDLLASNAARLATAYSQARQRNFSGAARTLGIRGSVRPGTKSASSGWLQLQFGWMPLASDIYGAYQELTMKKPQSGDLVVLRVSDDSTGREQSKAAYYPFGSTRFGGTEIEIESIFQRNFKQSYWWKLDLESLHAASRNGLTDPAVVAWDLVPFSFMVDWLLPVGQYLRNCTADLGFKYLGGSQTYFERRSNQGKSGKILPPNDPSYKDQRFSCRLAGAAKGFRMVRTVLPQPSAEMYIKNPLSTFTVITSLAILTQRFQSSTPWKSIARTTVRGG